MAAGGPEQTQQEPPLPRLLGHRQRTEDQLCTGDGPCLDGPCPDGPCPDNGAAVNDVVAEPSVAPESFRPAATEVAAQSTDAADLTVEGGDNLPLPANIARRSTRQDTLHGMVLRRISTWRWPSQAGKMPRYVQRNFRVKTFGLLSIQFSIVFGIMLVMEHVLPEMVERKSVTFTYLFYVLGLIALTFILILYFQRNNFPMNYALLGAVTLMVGLFWGVADNVVSGKLHFQLIAIMGVAMMVSTVVSSILSMKEIQPWTAVIASLVAGWAVGCVLDSCVAVAMGIPIFWAILAQLVALFLFGVLLCDAGALLVKCNPDDFLRVIIAMNSTLLVVVSIPVLVFAICFLHAGVEAEEHAAPEAPPEPLDQPAPHAANIVA